MVPIEATILERRPTLEKLVDGFDRKLAPPQAGWNDSWSDFGDGSEWGDFSDNSR